MTSVARFAAVLSIVAAGLAACGDHIVVPNDKTGKCVAGLLTKCGETCVDTQNDIANCGACGNACGGAKVCAQGKCSEACPPGSTKCGDVCSNTDVDRANCGACGKACVGNEVCAKGKCAPTCEAAGYLTCPGMMAPLDAGGATSCINPDVDEKNCGACGRQCAMGESCTKGTCCTTGMFSCNGACVDLGADVKNCGGCGVVCPMATPNCVYGQCSKCNNTILVLSDNSTNGNVLMKAAFKAAGMEATVIDNGAFTYSNSPPANTFGAIGIGPGNNFSMADMPMAGQQAIVQAQQNGTGIVLDGLTAYVITNYTRYQVIKPLALLAYTGGGSSGSTVGVFNTQFPFFAGISSFSTQNLWFSVSVLGGTQFATSSLYMTSGGQFRASPNGRVVHTSMSWNYGSGATQWTNEPSTTTWAMNMYRWAAGCAN